MAGNSISRDSTRFVALFQKAHGSIANAQRLDEQIAALFEQRRKALDDLRAIQAQINGEFDRMLELDRVVPADMLASAESGPSGNGRMSIREGKPADARMTRVEGQMPLDNEDIAGPRLVPRQMNRPQPQMLESFKQ